MIPHLQLQLRHLLLLAYADVFWPSLANLAAFWLFQPVVEILRWRCWGLLCCEMSSLFCFRVPKTPKTCRNLSKNSFTAFLIDLRGNRLLKFGTKVWIFFGCWVACYQKLTEVGRGQFCMISLFVAEALTVCSWRQRLRLCHPVLMKFYAATLKCIIHRSNIQGENLRRARVFLLVSDFG